MKPWWERDPGRLASEVRQLELRGATVRVDEDAQALGVLQLLIEYPNGRESLRLIATFPDFYPYFRPEVSAPDLGLARHQHPHGGNLCLLGRRTDRWFASWTLADLLSHQLPALLEFHRSGDLGPLQEVEEPIGEPVSEYYNSQSFAGGYVLFDGDWMIDPAVLKGDMTLRGQLDRTAKPPRFKGFIEQVSVEGRILAEWSGPRPEQFTQTFRGRWVRKSPAVIGDLSTVIDSLTPDERAIVKPAPSTPDARSVFTALVFPEEVRQRQFADGWAILQHDVPRLRRGSSRTTQTHFVRTARGGLADLAARMPASRTLSDKRVLLVGTGAIGGPLVLHLARAGIGQICLVDHDIVEPATVRRWPLGWSAFAEHKVQALKEFLAAHYPWTTVDTETFKLGAAVPPGPDMQFQGEALSKRIDASDLVIDSSAELGVNHLLSDLARTHGKSLVIVNGTPGIWGGMVAQFVPGAGHACWMCLRHALYGLEPSISLPPADPAGEVQPPGCAEATFTGAGFDAEEVSLEAVRVISSVLGADGGYPATPWQLGVLALRDDTGGRIEPTWTRHHVPRRPECACW